MTSLLGHLAGDCDRRDAKRNVYGFCGAFYPDLSSGRPPDDPQVAPARPKLRAVE